MFLNTDLATWSGDDCTFGKGIIGWVSTGCLLGL
jgi:hypothetical protein